MDDSLTSVESARRSAPALQLGTWLTWMQFLVTGSKAVPKAHSYLQKNHMQAFNRERRKLVLSILIVSSHVGLAVLTLPEHATHILLVSEGSVGLGAVRGGDSGLQLRPLPAVHPPLLLTLLQLVLLRMMTMNNDGVSLQRFLTIMTRPS